MFIYTAPYYTNPTNGLTATLSEEAIQLAQNDSDLLELCRLIIRRIAFQELYRINESIAYDNVGAFDFQVNDTLTTNDITILKKYFVPIHKLKTASYLQGLAKKLTVNDSLVLSFALIARLSIVNNGLLHLVNEDGLKIVATYDSDGISPLTTKSIEYNDVLGAIQIMLNNEPFLLELIEEKPLSKFTS